MNPRDFCNWISGVLTMAESKDGGIRLTETQYDKIKQRLELATEHADDQQPPSGAGDGSGFHRPPGIRC